jgi:hypothetical protein
LRNALTIAPNATIFKPSTWAIFAISGKFGVFSDHAAVSEYSDT